jgi:hypothetical protein
MAELLRIGAGFLCQDHKGDLADDLLHMIPRAREGDVCLLDLGDAAWPIGINILDRSGSGAPRDATVLADQAQSLFARFDPHWEGALGMQEFARNGLLALALGETTPTLLSLQRFYRSARYREQVCARLGPENRLVRDFWLEQFPQLSEQQRHSLQPLLRRLGIFLMHPLVRNVVAQPGGALDLRRLMDAGHILVAKIPVEQLGEQAGQFVSTLLLSSIVLAVLSRQGLPEQAIRDWPLIVDEFQVAAASGDAASIETMISRFRSFGAGPIFAHQSLSQLAGAGGLAEQLLANIQNRVVLGAKGGDAALWARQWRGQVAESDLLGLRRRENGYAELVVNEQESKVFSLTPLPLWPPPADPAPPYKGAGWQAVRAPVGGRLDAWLDERIAYVERLAAEHGEAAALEALVAAPAGAWQAYLQRTAAHRSAQRAYILANPGCVPSKAERIGWLSRLRYARPRLEVAAAIECTLNALPGDA